MRICYLLESADLWGGIRIAFDQVRGLTRLGHQVSVRTIAGDHRWYPYPLNIEYVDQLTVPFENDIKPDIVVCTSWKTVKPGMGIGAPVTVHLCQGYEGDLPELKDMKSAIEHAYAIPIPKLCIGKWLEDRLSNIFGTDSFLTFNIGQIVDTSLFKPDSFFLKRMLRSFRHTTFRCRMLVVGDYGASCKGIADALHAVALLRKQRERIWLIRVSLFPRSEEEEEAITHIDESYIGVNPTHMPSIYKNTDLLLAPSLANEGFGLPFAEALASGVPAIATKIPSFLSFDETHDYAYFVETHDPEGIAEAVRVILHNQRLAARLRRRGPKLIQAKFHIDDISKRIESVLQTLLSDT